MSSRDSGSDAPRRPRRLATTFAWRLLAVLALSLALAALALPVLPAVPFVLLAAAAAARGWPWLDARLVAHPTLGPLVLGWRERGALPRRAKAAILAGFGISAAVAWSAPIPPWAAIAIAAVLALAGLWLWKRPES